MIKKINHIGIAVENITGSIDFYKNVLGLNFEGEETIKEQQVKVAFFVLGDCRIELLEPLSPESPVAKFITKKGQGIHHIAFEVENIEDELSSLKKTGTRLINETQGKGAHGAKIAFIHPADSNGVLIEIIQKKVCE